MKSLTRDMVKFSVSYEPEDLPVRKNYISSGDQEFDRKCEDRIIELLDDGHDWAWCRVTVKASWKSFSVTESLGGVDFGSEPSDGILRSEADSFGLFEDAFESLSNLVIEKMEELKELM